MSQRGRTELKTIDTDTILSDVTSTGGVQLINGIAQGSDFTERIGRKVFLKSLFFRIFVTPSATVNSPTGTTTRLIIVYDCQTNAAAPTVANILQNSAYDSPMNLNNRDRFKVLYDKFVHTSATLYTTGALTAGDPIPRKFEKFKKLNLDVIFGGTGNTVASITTGSIYALLINSINTATQAEGYFRVRFMDA